MTPLEREKKANGRAWWIAIVILALAAAAIFLQGCASPKAGAKCSMGDAYCQGERTCLACKDGTLAPFDCTGPKGCLRDGARNVLCDQSQGAVPGTPCFPDYEGLAQCSPNSPSILHCKEGQWSFLPCPSGKQCRDRLADGVRCE